MRTGQKIRVSSGATKRESSRENSDVAALRAANANKPSAAVPRRSGLAALRWALVAVLALVAIAYFAMPTFAQERPGWGAELWATEGGEELVAAVGAKAPAGDELAPTLAVMCGLYLRYDPDPGGQAQYEWLDRSATFSFDFGGTAIARELQFEAMDGMFSTRVSEGDPLLAALEAGTAVTVRLTEGGLPDNSFSLAGSAAAIAEVRRACR